MSSLSIVGLDTLVAILAGLAIFPAVFAQGFDPEGGPGLVFQVLPAVFNTIPMGWIWASLFFILLFVAALTSGISLLEVVVSFAIDELKWSRAFSVIVVTAVISVLGSFCAVSVANWKNIEWLHKFFQMVFETNQPSFFDLMDTLASNWMLPLGGLFIALFVGWVWGTRNAVNEIRNGSHNFADVHLIALLAGLKDDPGHNSNQHVLTLASLWGIFIRFISPIAVLIAFLHTVGWIKI
jgi:NSS family neurotransmitter:Na+ symporter